MKDQLKKLIYSAAKTAHQKGDLTSPDIPEPNIEEPKSDAHGDFSTNIAMVMASVQKMAPRKIADTIIAYLDDPEEMVARTEVAGPGFINFFLHKSAWHPILREIHNENERFGSSDIGKGQKIQVEFVSSNPTGPLHIGHGRGAAVGDTVANLLSFCGYDVQREYYINDSGRQIRTLGLSVLLRYKQLFGQKIDFPAPTRRPPSPVRWRFARAARSPSMPEPAIRATTGRPVRAPSRSPSAPPPPPPTRSR